MPGLTVNCNQKMVPFETCILYAVMQSLLNWVNFSTVKCKVNTISMLITLICKLRSMLNTRKFCIDMILYSTYVDTYHHGGTYLSVASSP